ncbi:MAG: hypothetical protein KKF48_00605 [Nanoarchaeota archaeon]|nr:hypothetical protein [Nanoarchaeota archaeon]MBU1027523.1 hypothetical protein [Nanoarchaeota archaeon]
MHRFQLEFVPHHSQHMNFVFFGKCKNPDIKVKETDEKEKLRWFNKKEVLGDPVMLESVRKSALVALEAIKT